MKTNFFISAIIVFMLNNVIAQETQELNSSVKIYNLSGYEWFSKMRLINGYWPEEYESKTIVFFKPTFAVQWKAKSGNYHELELNNLVVAKKEERTTSYAAWGWPYSIEEQINTTVISFRYEYIFTLLKSEKRIMPSISLGVNPYFAKSKITPLSNTYQFITSEEYLGANFLVTPRIIILSKKKCFLDINIPLYLADFNQSIDKNQNPSNPINDRVNKEYNFTLIPKIYTARIGLGIKL
jgi:hypothetical protein